MTSNDAMSYQAMSELLSDLDDITGDKHHVRTRFAPSPNGYLHQGHALSAMLNRAFAKRNNGEFLLRIEDIDAERSRKKYSDMIAIDMLWLGLSWDQKTMYQSQHIDCYRQAFNLLFEKDFLYPCFCSRSDIKKALAHNPVVHGPDGPQYPGTCKALVGDVANDRCQNEEHCWRLDMKKLLLESPTLYWHDMAHGKQIADPSRFGDIVIWRKDAPASYHLAATVDDAKDHISHVIRGMDLFDYTDLHRLLQYHLNLPTPQYWHHSLLRDEAGEKLSKSVKSTSLFHMREEGFCAEKIIKQCLAVERNQNNSTVGSDLV